MGNGLSRIIAWEFSYDASVISEYSITKNNLL